MWSKYFELSGSFFLQLVFISVWKTSESISIYQMHVPSEVLVGDPAVLRCRFDLKGEPLYSVKWYKGTNEFFRYLPKDTPKAQAFQVPGIRVNLDSSNDQQVVLENVTLHSAGRYKCEVSGERPLFHTVFATSEMNVIVLPRDPPKIIGTKATYQVGDNLMANCSLSRSKPAANLTWIINGRQVTAEKVIKYPTVMDPDGLETSMLGLEFRVEDYHFSQGKLILTCTARISRMKPDSTISKSLSNSDAPDYPKQRSLESRPAASTSRCCTHVINRMLLLLLLLHFSTACIPQPYG